MSAPCLFDLAGRTALVTGSSRGIGRAIARGLAQAGADVAVHYTSSQGAAEETAQEIRAMGRKSAVLQAELSEPGAGGLLVHRTREALGELDILVLNASVQFDHHFDQVTPWEFDQQVNVNFRSVLDMLQVAVPAMQRRGWGRVLMIGSVQEYRPAPKMPVYAALKCATQSLVRTLAKDLGACGVTINNLAPGVIDTDRNAQALTDPQRRDRIAARVPVGRIGMAEDCVGPALLLCSDAGSYISGATLLVEGGLAVS